MRPSSGPASTSTAHPGCPVARTTASPCPTSQATIAHGLGGHPGGAILIGTSTNASPSSTAISNARGRRRRTSRSSTTTPAASSTAPTTPPGHGSAAPGTAAAASATTTSHHTAGPASHAHACAIGAPAGDTSAASTPSTVAGATAGTASRFASTAIGFTCPLSPATSGAVSRNAAAGTASASASNRGTRRLRSAATHVGASSTSAAVATTDSANPGSTASAGSTSSSTSTAVFSAGIADRPRPKPSAMSTTPAMTAARTTLGDGRASTTNPTTLTPLSTAASRGSARILRRSQSTAPLRIARFAPDTASRWVRPAARKSASTSAVRALVSPTARPGNKPADAGGNAAVAACRSPSRSPPAATCHHGGAATSRGGPRTRRTATVRSDRPAGASRPSAVTACPGSSSAHPSTGASSRMRPPADHRSSSTLAASNDAGTATCDGAPDCAP